MSLGKDRRDAVHLTQCFAELEPLEFFLSLDYVRSRAATSESDDPYSWRAFVRTLFATVDATLFRYRQYILAAQEDGLVSLTPYEISALEEQTHRIRANGTVKVASDAAAFLPTLRLTVSTTERLCAVPGLIDFGGDGWEAFRHAKAIRDRLTHPKALFDLAIRQADKEVVDAAADWFNLSMAYLSTAILCRFTEEEYGIVRVREMTHELIRGGPDFVEFIQWMNRPGFDERVSATVAQIVSNTRTPPAPR